MIQKILAVGLLLTAACSTPGSAPRTDAADAAPADNGFPPLPRITSSTISEIKISHGLADQPPETGEIVLERPDAGQKTVKKKTVTTKKTEIKTEQR